MCVCVVFISFRYVSWNQGDYSLHMVTELPTAGLLTNSGNCISAKNAGEPTGRLALSSDGAQLFVLSDSNQRINSYVEVSLDSNKECVRDDTVGWP